MKIKIDLQIGFWMGKDMSKNFYVATRSISFWVEIEFLPKEGIIQEE